MTQPVQPAITPSPTDEEAAAIIAALSAYLGERRATLSAPVQPARPWAIAGRLASQGQPIPRRPGVRATWANVERIRGE